MADKEALQSDEVGQALHTALRKCCDSTESSYLWNVIHLLDETWTAFCEAVVKADATDGQALQKVAADEASWMPKERSSTSFESFYARQVFTIALEDFDEWDGFACYLGPE